MAIATDIEVNWRGTVDNTNKIGLSSTLNLLGVNAFNNADFCLGFQNPALKLTKESEGYPKSTEASNNAAFYIANNVGYSLNGFNNPNGAYYRTLLLAVPTNWTWGWDSNLRSNNNTVRIVTKLDLLKNKCYLTTLETTKSDRVTANNLIYGVNESLPDTGALGILLVGNVEYKILCGNVYLTDNGYYIKFPEYIDPLYDNFNAQYGEGALPNYNYDVNSNMMFSAAPVMFSNAGWTISTSASGPAIYNVSTYNNTEVEVPPSADNPDYKIFGTYSRVGSFYWRVQYQMSVEYWLWLIASFGLLFEWNGTAYKPIIEYGELKGYTNDMTVPSDIDNWTDVSGHNISPTPPVPPVPPGPYDDDPWSGASFSGVGVGGAGAFAKCYYMTSTELANLRSWMNSNNVPEGFDPMQQIIGLSQVPVSLSGDDNTTVQFVNSSAIYDPGVTRVVDSGVNTQISMGTPKKYSLGSVDIVRRMQERGEPYLDYDCQVELYLPLIGMFSLDTQAVMGRTITAEAVLDPISGTLAAYAYVSKDGQNLPIAYGSTTIGVDLPISAQQYSVSRAALKQANAQLGASILSSTLSFIAAATAGGKGSGTGAKTATGTNNGLAAAGIREAGADYMKASQVGNIFGDFMNWGRTVRQLSYGNNTAIAGSFGGSTAQWAYPFTPYVKIIRPRYEKPANYNHSQGVPCVQTKTIGSCTGFIQCLGVDVSGISGATDLELQAIQAALSNGIYAGGGQS